MVLSRRGFIKDVAIVGGALALTQLETLVISAKQTDRELEESLLLDLLSFPANHYIDRKNIESILFDVKDKETTRGRAVHIGDGYFFTAYHVVDGNTKNIKLVPQLRRWGHLVDYTTSFKILDYDNESDIALLQAPSNKRKEGATKLHLASEIPSIGDKVSVFIRISNVPRNAVYEFEYDGKDFYDESKPAPKIGKLILPADSLLLEKEGKVLRYDQQYFLKIKGYYKGTPENENFTSISAFDGESGQPVFLKISDDKYVFAGIARGAVGIKHKIPTPNHPLGYKGMQQTGAFFVHREPIKRLILKYLKNR